MPAAALALAAGATVVGLLASELRLAPASQPLTDRWQHIPIQSGGDVPIGLSLRSPQVHGLGLDMAETLRTLLAYPFALLRLGAYWQHIEPAPGRWDFGELDAQMDAAERAGKQVILALGALKTFGYPEFFVPEHRLAAPIREGRLVTRATHPALLAAATEQVQRVVDRYRERSTIVAWQVEHESVDPLGMEHSWRLSTDFVEREIAAVRDADPDGRPVLLNGYLPQALLAAFAQWWRTRDQGDSLLAAQRLADLVGLDYYPRHALLGLGPLTLYLDGRNGWWGGRRAGRILRRGAQRVLVTEGQAEPWEAVTTPPNPSQRVMASCPPEQLIATYNACLRWARQVDQSLAGYLFWGAEYWVLRQRSGDPSYLRAFARVLEANVR